MARRLRAGRSYLFRRFQPPLGSRCYLALSARAHASSQYRAASLAIGHPRHTFARWAAARRIMNYAARMRPNPAPKRTACRRRSRGGGERLTVKCLLVTCLVLLTTAAEAGQEWELISITRGATWEVNQDRK